MARITAGIGTSHVPAIGAAIDHDKTQEDYWKPLFDGYMPAQEYVENNTPDVAILVYNDHASAFSLELISTFLLGVADYFPPADEGYGPRQVPGVEGHPELLTANFILDEFDMAIANEMPVDHGPPYRCHHLRPTRRLGFKVIPLCVNDPVSAAHGERCLSWTAIRKAVESSTPECRHLRHRRHVTPIAGERAGLINADFDTAFLTHCERRPAREHAHGIPPRVGPRASI